MRQYGAIQILNEDKSLDHGLASQPSSNPNPEDHLTPCFDCPCQDRPSNVFIGTFNLIASIVGGGVLSLPIVFSRCGIVFTTISMIFSAYITYISLVMLCYSSRRRGGSSYGEIMRSAFGERMEEAVSWLLFVFLMFVIIGYMVLIRDIWTPLVLLTPLASTLGSNDEDYVLMGILLVLMPYVFQRSLHALRYNCYVGFISVMILCCALWRGALLRIHDAKPQNGSDENDTYAIEYFKIPTIQDVLFSFPIVTCAFLCHFNVNSIQNSLSKPTRQRMQSLLQYTIITCFAVMYLLGLGGYLYAGKAVQGNILLNVPLGTDANQDEAQIWLFTAGRIGIGLTITLALPLMALPCRDSLLEIIDVWFHRSHHRSSDSTQSRAKEEQCCWSFFHSHNRSETVQDATITTEDEVLEELPFLIEDASLSSSRLRTSVIVRHEPIQKDYIFRNIFVHYGSTLGIICICYSGAVLVQGVAYVWSFIGSSMAFVIAFILPCGSFIVIENEVTSRKQCGDRKEIFLILAWIILIFSAVGAIVCTLNSLL